MYISNLFTVQYMCIFKIHSFAFNSKLSNPQISLQA